jgi:sugar phosphate isomerase/epimerase
MAGDRLISLAAGVMPEFAPEALIHAAAAAGFNAAGIWCEAPLWSKQRTHAVKAALKDTGLCPLDLEVIWFKPDEPLDAHDAMIDIALELGVSNVLCVSSEPDLFRTQLRFEHLCRRAEDSALRIVLEFLAITEVRSLQQALQVVREVAHPSGGILVDALHLYRTGNCAVDLAHIEPHVMPYIQLCDADAQVLDDSSQGLIEDALYLRKLPGEGELPLTEILHELSPQIPLSMEIRSRVLMEQTQGDPLARAIRVFEATQCFLQTQISAAGHDRAYF